MSLRFLSEKKIFDERKKEKEIKFFQNLIKEQKVATAYGKSDQNVEKKREIYKSKQEIEKIEKEKEKELKKSKEEEKKIARARKEFEEAQKEKNFALQIREEQLKKRICDTAPEIRELKGKLFQAKINKEIAAQLLEKNYRKEFEKIRETKFAEKLEEDRLGDLEAAKRREEELEKKKSQVKVINLKQIEEKEKAKVASLLNHLHEKDRVDQIVEKLRQEDVKEQEEKEKRKAQTRQELLNFMVEQEKTRKEKILEEKKLNDEIEAHALKLREREEKLAAEKEALFQQKLKIFQKMLSKAQARDRQAEELEYLRNQVIYEEMLLTQQLKEEAEMKKRIEDRLQMLAANNYQMEMKEFHKKRAEEEEAKFREQLLAKYAEDDRIEQLNAQKRRMKVLEHKRQVEKLVELKRKLYDEQVKAEIDTFEYLKNFEERRKNVIDEERRKLFKNFGKDLRNFLPKSVMDCEDLNALKAIEEQEKAIEKEEEKEN